MAQLQQLTLGVTSDVLDQLNGLNEIEGFVCICLHNLSILNYKRNKWPGNISKSQKYIVNRVKSALIR